MLRTDERYLVVGLGKSGGAAAEALLDRGCPVTVYDKKPEAELEPALIKTLKEKGAACLFGREPEVPGGFDVVVLSPGVSRELPLVAAEEQAGARVTGELELAWLMGRGCYVAITGTNGKTTTTVLTGEIFKNAGRKTEVVGNVGVAVSSRAGEADEDTWMITEASSFQLDATERFHPVISAILNVTPDHLDRHGTLENYALAKAKIFQRQTGEDHFIVNYDDKEAWKLRVFCKAHVVPFSRREQLSQGCFVKDGRIVIREDCGKETEICPAAELFIPGAHNLENALAASAMAYYAGIAPEVIGETLRSFRGVEHRMELCGQVDGVRFVNDSKGTNPDASIKAVEVVEGNIILIAGGYDKGASYEEFIGAFGGKVKALVLLGKTAPKIRAAAEAAGLKNIIMAADMEECVLRSFREASAGDTVLLSPACASWDMYSCFEERGEHFKACVESLKR